MITPVPSTSMQSKVLHSLWCWQLGLMMNGRLSRYCDVVQSISSKETLLKQWQNRVLCVLVQGFPKQGSSRMAAFAFHGGIASILGLYTLFWLKLNLMQTLPILLGLGIFTTIAGYNALSQQADSRLKQQ